MVAETKEVNKHDNSRGDSPTVVMCNSDTAAGNAYMRICVSNYRSVTQVQFNSQLSLNGDGHESVNNVMMFHMLHDAQ